MPTPARTLTFIPDISGHGFNLLNVGGKLCEEDGPIGRKQVLYGDGVPLTGAWLDATTTDLLDTTWVIHLMVKSLGEGSVGIVFDVEDGSGDMFTWLRTIVNGVNVYSYKVQYADIDAEWQWVMPGFGLEHTLVIEHLSKDDPSGDPRVWIDNTEVTVTNIVRSKSTLVSDAGATIFIGSDFNSDDTYDGSIIPMKLFGKELTATERLNQYLTAALRVWEVGPRYKYPVTLASVTGGEVGPWSVLSGTWDWVDNGVDARQLAKALAADVSRVLKPSSQAYGAWYFRQNKISVGGDFYTILTATARDSRVGATQDGYLLRLRSDEGVWLVRMDNGAQNQIAIVLAAGALALDTEYEWFIVRRVLDSLFTVYIRGGAWATWTSLGTQVDNTHTTSKFIGVDGSTAIEGTQGPMILFPRGGGLVPNDIPKLADAA